MKKILKKIYTDSSNNFYNLVKNNIINSKKMFIVTANPETLMISEKNAILKKALLDKRTYIIPDGIGIVKGLNFLGYSAKESIPGIELCIRLFEFCNIYKKKLFLFGASKSVIKQLVNVINSNYKNIIICGYENGYVENKEKIFDNISSLQPDVILVATRNS